MLKPHLTTNNKAQSVLEYTIIIGIIVIVLFVMNPLMKRGIQGMIKVVADQIGTQQNSDQQFDESGHLESSYVATRTSLDKQTRDFVGETNYTYGDVTYTDTETFINLGFTEE
jgi:uncharacterized protein (UPF0333 family)